MFGWHRGLLTLSLLVAAGCAVASPETGEDDAPFDDKLDSFFQPTHHGGLRPGDSDEAILSPEERFHSWALRLHGPAQVSITTSEVEEDLDVDTVVYLYQRQEDGRWGHYIGRNDDSELSPPWSQIDMELDAGEFRIIVKGYMAEDEGPFRLTAECRGDGCVGPEPTRLWVPLLDENDLSPLALQNEKIVEGGFEPLPVAVPITGDDTGYVAWSNWIDRVDEIDQAVDLGTALLSFVKPEDYYWAGDAEYDPVQLCYTGDMAGVPGSLEVLVDSVFSDQLALWAWKYEGEEGFADFDDEVDVRGWMPDAFQEFVPLGGEVMVVTTMSDSGEDFTAAVIPPCTPSAETD